MRWDFLPTLLHAVAFPGPPDAIVIKLGENNLPEWKGIDLALGIMLDLHELEGQLPHTQLFW